MRKKVIFFDIDGTLITEDTQIIPESTILSLKKAKENGHLLFINTGRTYCSIPNKINDLKFLSYDTDITKIDKLYNTMLKQGS